MDGQAAVNLVSGGSGGGSINNYNFHWNIPGTADTIYVNGLKGNQTYFITVSDNTGCFSVFEYFLQDPQPIIPALKTDSVSCFGLADGMVRITSVQSSRPIAQYQWNTGANTQNLSGLSAGTYTVVLTDTQGCTGSATATVPEPPPLTLQLDIQSLVCNNDSNGRIQVIAQGGNPGYSYSWNTGSTNNRIENLGPGDYAVTVSDRKGCTAEANTLLSQPNPPSIALELVTPGCNGSSDGLARLIVTGSSGRTVLVWTGKRTAGQAYSWASAPETIRPMSAMAPAVSRPYPFPLGNRLPCKSALARI